MSGSCAKADRNRKSASNTAYKAGNRHDIHRTKRMEAQSKFKARKHTETIKTPKGTARAKRRKESGVTK